MAYSDFTIDQVRRGLGLTISDTEDLYSAVPEIALPPTLEAILARNVPLGLAQGTEKGRSELIIAPILYEIRFQHPTGVAIFSGVDFNVDDARGLRGRCDFLLSRDPLQLAVGAPVFALVEAKHEDIIGGVPQCLAEMVAAQTFNERREQPITTIHGAVTSGAAWRFLRLEGTRARVDRAEYQIHQARKIFSILTHIVLGTDPA